MLGQIVLFAGNFAPVGWQLCAGQLMPINQNVALFSVLGTTYGGNGETNFALPDLRSHTPVAGLNFIIAVQGTFPQRM
jgi:microcystin-dependent protein